MAKAQTTISASSIWGGSITFQHIDSTEFARILTLDKPKEQIYTLKLIDVKYYQTSIGVLVSYFWGPSGLLFESIDDFSWIKENRISLHPPTDRSVFYQTQLIYGQEQVSRFEEELPNGFEKVGEDEYRNFYRSLTGQIASIDKYGRSGTIYPSKEIYIHELKSMGDVPFLAVPMEAPTEEE